MGKWGTNGVKYDKKANGEIQTNAKGEKQSAEIKEMRTEYHKYCPKSKSNNIIYCPKEIIKKKIKKDINKGMKLKKLNKHFERISDKKRKGKKKKETKRKTQKKDKKAKKKSRQKRRENKKGGGKKGDKKRKGKKRKGKKRKGKKRKGKKRKSKKRKGKKE